MTSDARIKAKGRAPMKPKAPPKLKPQGQTDGCKRTPVNLGDPYQGRGTYNVEAVLSEHLRQGVSFLHVKWQDIPEDGNTWEPIKHLVGSVAEAAAAAFREEQAKDAAAVRPPLLAILLLRLCAPILHAFRRSLNLSVVSFSSSPAWILVLLAILLFVPILLDALGLSGFLLAFLTSRFPWLRVMKNCHLFQSCRPWQPRLPRLLRHVM